MTAVKINIDKNILDRASRYSQDSLNYTSRKNDFHSGGRVVASQHMRIGKIGEFAFEKYLKSQMIQYIADNSNFDEEDDYDFIVGNILIDVKTRTKPYHSRILERVTKFHEKPKDIYVSVEYNEELDPAHAYILGFVTSQILTTTHPPQQFHEKGETNYYVYDTELLPIEEFTNYV